MTIKTVQFTHPGGQHSLNHIEKKRGIKEWNTGEHARKFLIADGQYVIGNKLSTPKDLLFWGEWEPCSSIKKTFKPADRILFPTYLHSPFLQLDKRGNVVKKKSNLNTTTNLKGCSTSCSKTCSPFQNTDPFVFGDCFFYSLCKQRHFSCLRNLDVGSIILFGSTISAKRGGPYFALDTVFVVGEKRHYTEKTAQKDLDGFIPQYYDEIMGFDTKNTEPLVCYKGASFNNPVNGMYSFVPCKPYDEIGFDGFKRAELRNADFASIAIPPFNQRKKNPVYISNNLNSSPNIIISDLAHNKMVWDRICQILDSQNYKQGLRFRYNVKIEQ